MRIIFAGTPEFAAAHLNTLIGEHDIVAVYTQPDRRAGRGKKMLASPVKQLAEENQLPVQQPLSLKSEEEQQILQDYNADIMVVAAYGMLLPQAVLDIPRLGCINVHASLLPRWRGAAPVERAIMEGDTETGITIMQMDAGLDTGDMLLKANCDISPVETGDSLREKLINLGAPLLIKALRQIDKGSQQPETQDDSLATYAKKLLKSETQINWQLSAIEIERKIRAFSTALPCYTLLEEQRVRINSGIAQQHESATNKPGTVTVLAQNKILGMQDTCLCVSCGSGNIYINKLQIPGGKSMSLASLLNGKPNFFTNGMQFASTPSKD